MKLIAPKPNYLPMNKLGEIILIVFAASIIIGVIKTFFDIKERYNKLWIESPTGKQIISMPLNQALRIMRKHNWHLAEVEPVMSRWKHLKKALFGVNRVELRK